MWCSLHYNYTTHLSTNLSQTQTHICGNMYLMLSLPKAIVVASSKLKTSSKTSPDSTKVVKTNQDLVVDFFKKTGFNDTHIKKLVSKKPDILRSNLYKTLKPKVEYFQELGLSGSVLAGFFADCPFILSRSLNTEIVPLIDFLFSVLGDKESVIRVILRSNFRFSSDLATKNVALLRSYGVPDEHIRRIVMGTPDLLGVRPEKLEEAHAMVEEKSSVRKIPVESKMYVKVLFVLASSKHETLERKLNAFREYGWTEEDIWTLMSKHPQTMKLAEASIRRKLEFYKEIGYEGSYIASLPVLMTTSMEKKIIPRKAVLDILKERELITSTPKFYVALAYKESVFLNRFVIPFKDEVPGLYEAFVNNQMEMFRRSCSREVNDDVNSSKE